MEVTVCTSLRHRTNTSHTSVLFKLTTIKENHLSWSFVGSCKSTSKHYTASTHSKGFSHITRVLNTTISNDWYTCFVCNQCYFINSRDLRYTYTCDYTCCADRTRSYTYFYTVRTRINKCLCCFTRCNISGVPFSNPAWSGCLNFSDRFQVKDVLVDGAKDLRFFEKAEADRRRDGVTGARRISMVSARNRDSLVFRAPAPDRMYDVIDQLRPSLRTLAPEHNDIFCEFALAFCQAVTRKAMGRKQMWYFDLNEVMLMYLQDVLPNPDHPMHRLLFDSELRQGLEAAIGEPITWFYTPLGTEQRRYFNKVIAEGDALVGYGGQVPLEPEEVCLMLETGVFCPGVLLTFAALSFVNGFRCLGSFEQVQYLEKYRKALAELGWPEPGALDSVDKGALTSGRCVDEKGDAVFPLDVSLGLKWFPKKGLRVWDLVEPLVPRLVGKARG